MSARAVWDAIFLAEATVIIVGVLYKAVELLGARRFHHRDPDEVTVHCGTCGRTYTYRDVNQTAAATRLHDELYCTPARQHREHT